MINRCSVHYLRQLLNLESYITAYSKPQCDQWWLLMVGKLNLATSTSYHGVNYGVYYLWLDTLQWLPTCSLVTPCRCKVCFHEGSSQAAPLRPREPNGQHAVILPEPFLLEKDVKWRQLSVVMKWCCLGFFVWMVGFGIVLFPCGTAQVCRLGSECEEFYPVLGLPVALAPLSTGENTGVEDAPLHGWLWQCLMCR